MADIGSQGERLIAPGTRSISVAAHPFEGRKDAHSSDEDLSRRAAVRGFVFTETS